MNIEADALALECVDQLWGQTRQIDSQPLDAIIEIGIDSLHHGIASSVVDVHGCDTTGFDVVEEAPVAHPSDSGVPGSHGRSVRLHATDSSVAHDLPADQQNYSDRQQPENKKAPALIHDPEK